MQHRRALWRGRTPDRPLRSVNILTLLRKLLDVSADPSTNENLIATYERPCDAVHPSASCYQVYWKEPVAAELEGQGLIEITHGAPNTVAADLAVDVFWTLGWCAYRARSLWAEADRMVTALRSI